MRGAARCCVPGKGGVFVAYAVWPRLGSLGEVLSVVSVRFAGEEYFFRPPGRLAVEVSGVLVVLMVRFERGAIFSRRDSRGGMTPWHAE